MSKGGAVVIRHWRQILLGLLLVASAGAQLYWIWEDQTRLPVGEGYVYLSNLFELMDGVGRYETADLWSSLGLLSKGGRPPLYQLLTMPFISLFGRSEDAALCVNVLFLAILVYSTYGMGRLAGGANAGLLAAFLVVSYPPIVNLTRVYLPHSVLPACVALSSWLLLLLLERRSSRIAWAFGASLAFGLLVHPRFAYVALGPAVIFVIYMVFFQPSESDPRGIKGLAPWLLNKLRDRFVLYGLLPAALIALGLALPWYLTRGLRLLQAQQRLKIERTAGEWYSIGFPDIEPSFWWYLRTTPGAISNVLAACLMAGMVSALFRRRLHGMALLITLIAGYAVLGQEAIIRCWWNFALVLPLAAALTAIWAVGIRRRWLSHGATAVCVVAGALNFALVSWGGGSWSRPVALALGSPLSDDETCNSRRTMALCPTSPRVEHWPVPEIQRMIFEDPDCQSGRRCQVTVIAYGERQALLSQVLFNYYLARDQLQARMVGGPGSPAVKFLAPYDLAGLLESDYLLFPDIYLEQPADSYYGVSLRFLQSAPEVFTEAHRQVATFEPSYGPPVRLVKRIKPLTIREAETSISALELAEVYKSRKYQLLATLYAREGQLDQVVRLWQQALEGDPGDVTARMRLAEAYGKLGSREQAIAELQRVIGLAPRSHLALRSLGDQYLALGENDRAVELYRETVEISAGDLAARIKLGRALARTGDVDAAISELESAIRLAPDNIRPRHALAGIHRSQGNRDRAIAIYEEIREMDPTDERSRDALARLQRFGAQDRAK